MSATLIDTSPLVAIANAREGLVHRKCVRLLKNSEQIFVTTLPVLTETMYFLGEAGGWHLQERIWKLLAGGSISVFDLTENTLHRMSELMSTYRDTPMDFADASLVAAAETLNTSKIFTLDSDFSIYRLNGKTTFEIIP